MPKVKNPLLSMEARGGIGGLVYNTWRGINTVKTNTSPTGQGTAKRLAAQGLISMVSADWQTLSDATRASWNQYATDHPVPDWTGSPKRLTGMNWFVSCNIILTRMGATAITAPPVVAAPNPIVGLTLAKATTDINVAWSAPVAAGDMIEFWCAGPQSAGRIIKIEQCQYLDSTTTATEQPYTLIEDAVVARYTVFARVDSLTTGLVSTWQSAVFDYA